MNNKFTYLLSLLALLFVSVGASAQAGAVNGDFRSNATGNWSATSTWQQLVGGVWTSNGIVPTGAGIGKIWFVSPFVVTLDQDVEINTVEIQSGGELDFANNGINHTVTQDQGSSGGPDVTVDAGGILTFGFFNFWQVGTGSPTVMVNGSFTWRSGEIHVPVTIASGATANLLDGGTPADKDLFANFTNSGTLNWNVSTAGDVFMSGGITFTNTASGVINEQFIGTNNRAFSGTTANTMINQGIINKTTSNNLNIGVTFNGNTGTIRGNGASSGNFGAINFTTLGGAVSSNTGTMSPGNGPGASVISGSLTLDQALITGKTPTLSMTITSNGAVAGTNYDQAVIGGTGAVDISGTTLDVTDQATDAVGTTYTVLSAPNGIVNGGTTATFAATNLSPSLGNLTIGANSVTVQKINTLPLTWGSFNALAQANGTVSLNWSTLQEENTAHFVVEHSSDGSSFTAIGTVGAAGNSAQTSQYSFVDAHPTLNGSNFYRLQEVDLDGKINYSSIRAVSFKNGQLVKVLANPNPTHDLLNLNVQGNGIRALFVDALGHTLHAWILQNGYQQVNVQDVPAGEYQLLIYQNNQKIDVQHIVKF